MTPNPSAIDAKTWKRLRYRGVPLKQHVLAQVPASVAPLIGDDRALQSFKQQCAAEGNILPSLISQLEPQDPAPGMFRRRAPRKPKGSDPFADLPPVHRAQARERFGQLCDKWAGNLPSWRRAVLAGCARRLTLHPPGSEWGRRMRRIKGGVHCQRKYREQGWHPLVEFNQAMTKRRNEAAAAARQPMTRAEQARTRLGLTPEQLRGVPRIGPILESVPGGLESALIALRWSQEEDALPFLRKYDSVPPADREHLSVDEISVAAGIDPRRLLALAVDEMMALSVLKTVGRLVVSLPDVADAMIQSARTLGAKGSRDRLTILEITGIVPSAQPRTGLMARRNEPARKTQVAVPSLAEVLNRPSALPGKLGCRGVPGHVPAA